MMIISNFRFVLEKVAFANAGHKIEFLGSRDFLCRGAKRRLTLAFERCSSRGHFKFYCGCDSAGRHIEAVIVVSP